MIMKIDKIKMIENPIEDFQLDQESMKALLGGDFVAFVLVTIVKDINQGLVVLVLKVQNVKVFLGSIVLST